MILSGNVGSLMSQNILDVMFFYGKRQINSRSEKSKDKRKGYFIAEIDPVTAAIFVPIPLFGINGDVNRNLRVRAVDGARPRDPDLRRPQIEHHPLHQRPIRPHPEPRQPAGRPRLR